MMYCFPGTGAHSHLLYRVPGKKVSQVLCNSITITAYCIVFQVSLELGGKSPLIIFGDCDMEKAIKNALSSVFFNKGENCIAAGR